MGSHNEALLEASPTAVEKKDAPRRQIRGNDPADDPKGFRHCLGQFATGITVVTTRTEQGYEGMAANSFAAVSLAPPLVLWSVRKASRRAETFAGASHFAINILADAQVPISQAFSSSTGDPFGQIDWLPDSAGSPIVSGALAHMSCQLEATHDAGDHIIIVGRVLEYVVNSGKPLLFAQGKYALTQEEAFYNPKPVGTTTGHESHPDLDAHDVMRLLRRAQDSLSRSFDEQRQQVGLSVIDARILAILDDAIYSQSEVETLVFAGQTDTRESLAKLEAAGFIERSSNASYAITEAGKTKRAELSDRARAFSSDRLNGLSPTQIQAAKGFLGELVKRFS